MDTSTRPPYHWGTIFVLLSLDRADPVIPFLGVSIPDRARFRSTLRSLILDNRREYLADTRHIPDLAAKVLAFLERDFGPEHAAHFFNWATTVFGIAHSDQPQWSEWSMLFRTSFGATRLLERAERRGVLSGDQIQELADCLARHPDERRLADAIAEAKAPPMSDWDLEMYAIHGYADGDLVHDLFDTVEFVAELNGFQEFWEWMRARLTAEQKDGLRALGQEMVDERKSWLPGPLAHPDQLVRHI